MKWPIAYPLAAALISVPFAVTVRAGQVVFDGTLPNTHAGALAPSGTTFTIDPSSGYLNGTNLFHSFSYFNIDAGETAHFTGDPTTINNIIARVTGGTPSTINGTIISDIPNFWFINPAGIAVGHGAVLNVANNLALATTDFVQFTGGERWYAGTAGGTPVNLIVSDPVSFGLLPGSKGGSLKIAGPQLGNPGSITDPVLQIAGGDIDLQGVTAGILLASGNTVSIGNVSVTGNTATTGSTVDVTGNQSIEVQNLTLGQRVSLSLQSPAVSVDGATSGTRSALNIVGGVVQLQNLDFSHASDDAYKYDVVYSSIQGSDISLKNSSIAANALSIQASGMLSLDGSHLSSGLTAIGSTSQVNPVGAPNIVLTGRQISITGNSSVSAETNGFDQTAGTISITANSSIVINKSTVEAIGAENGAGNVSISAAGPVSIVDGALVDTSSVLSPNMGALVAPSGGGGNINISGSAVTIGASRVASTEEAEAQGNFAAGNVKVTSLSSITVDNSTIDSSSEASGDAGTISLSAPAGLVVVQNLSKLSSEYVPDHQDATIPAQVGANAGDIRINAHQVQIVGGSSLNTTALYGSAGAGSVAINSSGDLLVDHATLNSSSADTGIAGNVLLTGDSVAIHGGVISTIATNSGSGGDITIEAQGRVGADGQSAPLLVDAGAQIRSDALPQVSTDAGGTSATNAGSIALRANTGTVQISGVLGDTQLGTSISTTAGAKEGSAGAITIAGANIALQGASLSTSVDSQGVAANPQQATIELQSPGLVSLTASKLQATTSGPQLAGAIQVTGSNLDITDTQLTASTTGSGKAGSIAVTATGYDRSQPALLVTGASQLQSSANSGTASPDTSAGSVTLSANAGTLKIAGSAQQTVQISSSAGASSGAAGDIQLSAANLDIENVQISTTVATTNTDSATAPPARIALQASNSIQLQSAQLSGATQGVVPGGDILIAGSPVSIAIDGSNLSTTAAGTGNAGNITITGGTSLAGAAAAGALGHAGGNADGSSSVTEATVSITGTTISSDSLSSAAASAAAGTISIASSGDISLANSSLSSNAGTNGAPGGNIHVTGANLFISGSEAGGTISTSTAGAGRAGEIDVNASGSLSLIDAMVLSASSSTATSAGPAGTINLSGASYNSVNSSISATIAGGDLHTQPGNILITSGSSPDFSIVGGQITTQASQAQGGNITLNMGGSPVQMRDTLIEASAGANGNGGNIEIDQAGSSILEGTAILAKAFKGNGGRIDINLISGAQLVRDSQTQINADSDLGNNGTVSINTPDTDLNSVIQPQNVEINNQPELHAATCAPRTDVPRSTLTREGTGGVATSPESYLQPEPREAAARDAQSGVNGDYRAATHVDSGGANGRPLPPCG